MRILLLNQFFWPDAAPTGALLTDVARSLSEAGHDVCVSCGGADYAGTSEGEPPSVNIWRSPTFPFGRTKAARLLSYFSFFSTAAVRGLAAKRFDLVVTLTTPPLLSILGTALKKLGRAQSHLIWEMDVYPDVAVDVGMWNAESKLTKLVGVLADYSRKQADGVVALGPCMRDRLIERGVPESKLHVAENWADGTVIEPMPLAGGSTLTMLYSGNLGLAHETGTIGDIIEQLKNDSRFRFVFAGGGALREDLEKRVRDGGAKNAVFRGYCAKHELSLQLGAADLGLVTQKESCNGSVVPSKVYSFLAAGRPIFYIGPATSTPARLIAEYGCGWQIGIGDAESAVRTLEALQADPKLVRDAGQRARRVFMENYDRHLGVGRICRVIADVTAHQTGSVPVVLAGAPALESSDAAYGAEAARSAAGN